MIIIHIRQGQTDGLTRGTDQSSGLFQSTKFGLTGRRILGSQHSRDLANIEEHRQTSVRGRVVFALQLSQGFFRRGRVLGHQQIEIAVLIQIDESAA